MLSKILKAAIVAKVVAWVHHRWKGRKGRKIMAEHNEGDAVTYLDEHGARQNGTYVGAAKEADGRVTVRSVDGQEVAVDPAQVEPA